MSEITLPTYQAVESALKEQGLASAPAELHGLLSGMICGGLSVDDDSWVGPVCDYANEGEPLTDGAKVMVRTLFSTTANELFSGGFEFSLLMPDDDEPLTVRADALTEWVNSFISGLGLMDLQKNQLSEAVTEALADLQDIAQLGVDEDDDMEEQAALFEQVVEHVRMCVLSCHSELGQRPAVEEPEEKPTLH
ncbi:YecA/YgfB family protein [Photobacterium leiognathi]|uniref:YecA/YgfB family protein n=1 Tax=Photobacterium leiognathi TaxID=553611 RepID=UPI002982B49D|nr:YecA family protein [Photobacterium leiognathi]